MVTAHAGRLDPTAAALPKVIDDPPDIWPPTDRHQRAIGETIEYNIVIDLSGFGSTVSDGFVDRLRRAGPSTR